MSLVSQVLDLAQNSSHPASMRGRMAFVAACMRGACMACMRMSVTMAWWVRWMGTVLCLSHFVLYQFLTLVFFCRVDGLAFRPVG